MKHTSKFNFKIETLGFDFPSCKNVLSLAAPAAPAVCLRQSTSLQGYLILSLRLPVASSTSTSRSPLCPHNNKKGTARNRWWCSQPKTLTFWRGPAPKMRLPPWSRQSAPASPPRTCAGWVTIACHDDPKREQKQRVGCYTYMLTMR